MTGQEQESSSRATGSDDLAAMVAHLSERWPKWEREGIGPDRESIISAAAVGLVLDVWRNSPLEDMHAGGGMRGKGPDDPEMFAESTALHRQAVAALRSGDRFALLEFEDHVLDRHRPWAGGGRTLQEMGYGYLGAFSKHVKGRTNALMGLEGNFGRQALLAYLIVKALFSGTHHKGMPAWPAIVATVCAMIEDSSHEAWRDGERCRRAMDARPSELPVVADLRRTLLEAPETLPMPVLEWLCTWRLGPMLAAISHTSRSRR
ncbi:hypothetical protein ACFPKZ_02575 [Streptosporangium amethystogenes subsp. fukuiense]|uniref:hypothetical protein n=1 Tax=Streptosporangium amethystogenes TaxID=2002 RepID=UPI003385255A